MDRRDFLSSISALPASAIGATAAAADTVIDYSRDAGDALMAEVEQRLEHLSQQFSELTGRLSNRLDGTTLQLNLLTGQLAAQQAMLKLLFLLVLLSFVIDGGMALHLIALEPAI